MDALERVAREVASGGGLQTARETVTHILRRLRGWLPGTSTRQRSGAARGVGTAEAAPQDAIGDEHRVGGVAMTDDVSLAARRHQAPEARGSPGLSPTDAAELPTLSARDDDVVLDMALWGGGGGASAPPLLDADGELSPITKGPVHDKQ